MEYIKPTRRKICVGFATAAAAAFLLISFRQELYDHSTKKKENILVLEPKSLIPFSQKWAQKQFQYTLTLMGKEYSTDERWSNCNGFTTYYENIKVIFTKIAKAGSSNWVEALLVANGDITSNLTLSERSKELNSGKFDYHLLPTAREFYSDEVFQDAFSFTALRNPWTRMVSGYKNKLEVFWDTSESITNTRMQIVEEMRGVTDKEMLRKLCPSFDEFVKWLIKHVGSKNGHFKPQISILCIPEARYDYIIPLEYSTLLSDEVWNLISANTTFRGSYDGTTDPRVQRSVIDAMKMLSDLDKDTIEKLYEIYRMDFSLLNYSNFTHPDFPLPLYEHD